MHPSAEGQEDRGQRLHQLKAHGFEEGRCPEGRGGGWGLGCQGPFYAAKARTAPCAPEGPVGKGTWSKRTPGAHCVFRLRDSPFSTPWGFLRFPNPGPQGGEGEAQPAELASVLP